MGQKRNKRNRNEQRCEREKLCREKSKDGGWSVSANRASLFQEKVVLAESEERGRCASVGKKKNVFMDLSDHTECLSS